MALKTFNIYCDESCHLENDHKRYMLLGSISSAYNQVKRHTERINNLKRKHHYFGEIKWSNVSNSQLQFYKELVDYFFDTDLRFRAVVIDKSKVNNEDFQQDFDTFYYKMYYYLLNHNKNSQYAYNVYLDIKDDLSAIKVQKLKKILNTKFGVFRNIQNIRSHESILLQLTDFIMGALSYNLNDENQKVIAKRQLIERIKNHAQQNLKCSSDYNSSKLNLFFIELQ
ncbi:DUF3800 domain-containing protein [Sunxiuqinia elliptica]|uniref:DUF3800 domain-containing protein n=1 Tax=Sunxiuqinia elliptica TaxID=655355 RepID=A0A1I2CHD2_9BACT|nr:DUF3800 domain-containing protein [Sunxiuqinia elliptica]SFE67757.1 Protein of unknown function [Sunxiuqinia elliptica]